jgi:hypothetical protein
MWKISEVALQLHLSCCNYSCQESTQNEYTLNVYYDRHLSFSKMRLRWSWGSMLSSGTQVRGFEPGRNRRIFQGEIILGMPSFGGEVKPSVSFRTFVACKRSLQMAWNPPFVGKITGHFSPTVPGLLVVQVGTSKAGLVQ